MRDMREYQLTITGLATDGTGTIGYVAIPASGDLVKITAVLTALSDADQTLTFEIGGNLIEQGGETVELVMLNADVVGDIQVVELTANVTTMLLEAQDGDAIAAGSVLEIIADAAGSGGTADVTLTIRP
jgi:hypothetical protein